MKHELLVPVGDYASLLEAINNGADAVYLGGKKFGARAFADNFTLEGLNNATKLCHLYGVKIYITVNTLIYESEIDEALDYIKSLHKIGVDALIMQDVGLINLVHQTLPNMEIHASTQMHNHSEESIKFLKDLGVKRIVFARELSLDYINNIKTHIEKEVFIHGSLCISYSGQCLFSSFILNRSGNRGECAGMCRLPYELYENDKLVLTDGNYLLSPKDLCSIASFDKLMQSNVKSFKIEGRMKSPAYVGIVTKIYRKLIDQYENKEKLQVLPEDLDLLKAIYNREYTTGYLFNDYNIMNIKAPNHQGISLGVVTNVTKKRIEIKLDRDLKQFEGIRFKKINKGVTVNFMYNKNGELINEGHKGDTIYLDNFINLKNLDEVVLTSPLVKVANEITKKIPVTIKFTCKLNQNIEIEVKDNENVVKLESPQKCEKAKNTPLENNRIKESLLKVGNTPFMVSQININTDENIFIPVSVINNLRRDALNKLKEIRENKKVQYIENEYQEIINKEECLKGISVLAKTKEQIRALKELNVKNIIVSNKNLMTDDLIYRIPRDNMHHSYPYSKLMATDYASLDKYKPERGDYFLNITNHYTLDYLNRYARLLTISPELSIDNMKDIMKHYNFNKNIEVLIYGNVELMIMKYCPLNFLVNKDKQCSICQNNNKYYLKDRNNAMYRLENNPSTHSTTILNYKKIDLINEIGELKKMGINNFRIELLDEDYNETKKLIERLKVNYE